MLIACKLSQIACADVILINKTDLVEPTDLEELQGLVEKVNPAASIYRTTRGSIDLKLMMGIDAYSSRKAVAPTPHASHTHSESCKDSTHGQDEHAKELLHYEVRGPSSTPSSAPDLKARVKKRRQKRRRRHRHARIDARG